MMRIDLLGHSERLLVTEGEVRSQAAAAQPHASRDSWRRGSEGWELKEAEGGKSDGW